MIKEHDWEREKKDDSWKKKPIWDKEKCRTRRKESKKEKIGGVGLRAKQGELKKLENQYRCRQDST